MTKIPDFTDTELWTVRNTLEERYRTTVEPDLAETELRLDPHSTVLTPCPAIFWQHDGANFIVVKTGDRRYRGQFFYRLYQMYGTGIEEFDELAQCVVTLLQVQADQAVQEREEQEKNQDK